MINIILVTAHPDDEILWLGSTLYEFKKISNINIHIICLWAILEPPGCMKSVAQGYKDIDRHEQFYDVIKYMNYDKSHIVFKTDYPVIQRENQKDYIIEDTFTKALEKIEINITDISMIITHSNFGDERKHPHHIRMYDFFADYTLRKNIGFGFFSILKLQKTAHSSILKSTNRLNQLHLLSYDMVGQNDLINPPCYCIEFQGNLTIKNEALKLYKAIDYNKHYNDYMSFSVITERIYFNEQARYVFDWIITEMNIIVKDVL